MAAANSDNDDDDYEDFIPTKQPERQRPAPSIHIDTDRNDNAADSEDDVEHEYENIAPTKGSNRHGSVNELESRYKNIIPTRRHKGQKSGQAEAAGEYLYPPTSPGRPVSMPEMAPGNPAQPSVISTAGPSTHDGDEDDSAYKRHNSVSSEKHTSTRNHAVNDDEYHDVVSIVKGISRTGSVSNSSRRGSTSSVKGDFLSWDASDVGIWIAELNMAQYTTAFVQHDIDGRELITLTDERLGGDLGITDLSMV